LNADWYWAGIVGRVKPPDGADPLGDEVDDPEAGRRRPNRPPAADAGTPWLSKHWVYFVKAADVGRELDGVVVGEAVALFEPPPHALSSVARARKGRITMLPRIEARLGKDTGWVTR
jgi:hypothetical protein